MLERRWRALTAAVLRRAGARRHPPESGGPLCVFCVAAILAPLADVAAEQPAAAPRPNVLLVVFDDLNDWTEVLSSPGLATPNLKRLADDGVVFTRAYAASPICNPSRVALMTGVAPSVSGIYHNKQVMPAAKTWIAEAATLPRHFRDHGYIAAGYGKLFHHTQQAHYEGEWTPGRVVSWQAALEARLPEAAQSRTELPVFPRHFGVLPDSWDRGDRSKMQQDTLNTERAVAFLAEEHGRPFFLALGIYRPHSRYYAAERYWERVPRDTIQLAPGIAPDDLDDVPPFGKMVALSDRFNTVPPYRDEAPGDFVSTDAYPDHLVEGMGDGGMAQPYLRSTDTYRDAVRAYLAASVYADDLLGRVLDALDGSDYADNTIVVVLSDHGYHLGEKQHWHKFALWERATRVPLIVRSPALPGRGARVHTPVSLLDVYPTLLSLAGLPPPRHSLSGTDLLPLLRNEPGKRRRAVVTTYYPGFHAVRDERYRYIRYPDGSDELYDLRDDPWEWHNLAAAPDKHGVVSRLAAQIPAEDAPYAVPAREPVD